MWNNDCKLAINTIFYAAILWPLVAGPGWIRRFIRIKRGRCGACGYPVGTSPLCTKCGNPVVKKLSAISRQRSAS
jgi:hypothetical protein